MTVQDVGLTPTSVIKGLIDDRASQQRDTPVATARNSAYLFSPLVDFLGLGGGSLLALALILVLAPGPEWRMTVALWTLLATNVINHPHFAFSYQIFYRDFRRKAFGSEYRPALRLRYLVAGIVVPLALAGYFAACILTQDLRLLGYGVNIMGFFVGWHYVKQGYGMIIVDSVLKKRFFSAAEKKVLLVNAYACWIASWMVVNISLRAGHFWDVQYFTLEIPSFLVLGATIAALACGGVTLYMLLRKTMAGNKPPLNGCVAYFTSLYIWLLAAKFNPFFILVIPAFHSLQYMVVVWRYRVNRERDTQDARAADGRVWRGAPLRRLAGFAIAAAVLGFTGFWGLPILLDNTVTYDKALFGGSLFLFVFWISINVHHYFLDNVMWRRENPDTGKYLFGRL
jgi:hypothetical protein